MLGGDAVGGDPARPWEGRAEALPRGRAPLPAAPLPAPRAPRVAALMMRRAPGGLPLARAGGGSQWQPTPAAGKLLPADLAARETVFPRKSAAALASCHRTARMNRTEIPPLWGSPSPPARLVPEPGAHPEEALTGTRHPRPPWRGRRGRAPELHNYSLHRHGNSLDAAGWICVAHLLPGS